MTPTQLAAFKALMISVLDQNQKNEGYDELEEIRAADHYITKGTGKSDVFGSGNYYIAFLGNPSITMLWELQFGGHHDALRSWKYFKSRRSIEFSEFQLDGAEQTLNLCLFC